jgi:hypothetical protein
MIDGDATACAACGGHIETFVQYGSYFARCAVCGDSGWATSWTAVSNRLEGRWNAAVIVSRDQRPAFLAEGLMREVGDAITLAAQEGKLVRLRAVIG